MFRERYAKRFASPGRRKPLAFVSLIRKAARCSRASRIVTPLRRERRRRSRIELRGRFLCFLSRAARARDPMGFAQPARRFLCQFLPTGSASRFPCASQSPFWQASWPEGRMGGLMRRMLGYGLILLAIVVGGALAWLYTPDEPRAALEAQYAGPPSVFLDVAGMRLHVRDTGPRAAPAVIFLHGFGSSLQTWEDWARDLERDHRVIRYDMPGFGLTGPDPSGDYTDGRSIAV